MNTTSPNHAGAAASGPASSPDSPPAAVSGPSSPGPASAPAALAPHGACAPPEPAPADPPAFPRYPGETPRAFAAFLAYFQLGQTRSLPAVADCLGENPATVKNWSSKYQWSHRLHSFYSGLLHAHAQTEAARQLQPAGDWARRTRECREQEWAAGQKLLTAALCFLENFGDRDVEKMNLGQVSRALQVSTCISRQALRGDHTPEDPAPTAHQAELAAALNKAYGQPATLAAALDPSPVSNAHD